MSTAYHIVDTPLPVSEDFSSLKRKGLGCIQEYMSGDWTNLNASDPGITILDQVCYALTELGYCTHFSIADILTAADGKINFHNQFYRPDEVLTTAPVTIDDYRKYLIGLEGIYNAVITPLDESNLSVRIYKVMLYVDSAAQTTDIAKAAFYYLNKSRNLGELFLVPKLLVQKVYTVCGTVDIADKNKASAILDAIQHAVTQYIFPVVKPVSYPDWKTHQTNAVLNGPVSKGGWVSTEMLGKKKDSIEAVTLTEIIRQVQGVVSVKNISLIREGGAHPGEKPENSLPFVDISKSIAATDMSLQITVNGTVIDPKEIEVDIRLLKAAMRSPAPLVLNATADASGPLPAGKFRDINSYYSIQNTFPEIFRVGAGAVSHSTAPFRVAQSLQLKGYLTLFDQWLANQFAQLANIGRLFSFKNSSTGNPSDLKEYYAVQTPEQAANPEYPVPYTAFSPSYFYQSLFDVPGIRPLLKHNDAFAFSIDPEPALELSQKSWEQYRLDPYNPYIRGLMELMQDDDTDLSRRDEILDHLLARHGESPMIINTIIDGSVYTSDPMKDRVILKSLYLQHLGLLSYNRFRSYNFLAAKALIDHGISAPGTDDMEDVYGSFTEDFVVNPGKIDSAERLTETDIIHYSAIELKLCMLFGLRSLYRRYIVEADDPSAKEVKMAYWLITSRRGCIMIETALLKYCTLYLDADTMTVPPASSKLTVPFELVFLFPDFVDALNADAHKQRVSFFLQDHLPANMTFSCCYVNSTSFLQLAEAYTAWHNGMNYIDEQNIVDPSLATYATSLIRILNNLHG